MAHTPRYTLYLLGIMIFGIPTCVSTRTSEFISLNSWLEQERYTLYLLWPLPDGMSLLEPPRHASSSELDYVWMWYVDKMGINGIEPTVYMLFESGDPIPVSEHVLTDYTISKTVSQTTMLNLSGEDVRIEVRTNVGLPESGVALFEINGTHIAYHWRQASQESALRALGSHLTSTQNNPDLVEAVDLLLEHVLAQGKE